jgi:hypothetical protein
MNTTGNSNIINRSGSIALGGKAQTFAPAKDARLGASIRNTSAGSLWMNDTGEDATMDHQSLEIKTGEYFEWPPHAIPSGPISIIGATTGQTFYGRDW